MITLKAGTPTWDMLGKISPKLFLIFADFYTFLVRKGFTAVTITSIIREKDEDSGVHALGRAIDVSISGMKFGLPETCEKYINEKYVYDDLRPSLKTLVLHTGVGYNNDIGAHIHLQSRD